jgi:hypothetical protein
MNVSKSIGKMEIDIKAIVRKITVTPITIKENVFSLRIQFLIL